MRFDDWWETEGSVMEETKCMPRDIAHAAWFVAKIPKRNKRKEIGRDRARINDGIHRRDLR